MPVSVGVFSVRDFDGRRNWVLYRPSESSSPAGLVVFFPGDVSDFTLARAQDPRIQEDDIFTGVPDFSLETIMWNVCSIIPRNYSLVLFKPNMMYGYYSIYSNFVLSDSHGNPRWNDSRQYFNNQSASRELLAFVHSLRDTYDDKLEINRITLVGFSKGCMLLSTILAELDPQLFPLIVRVLYLDPGASVPNACLCDPGTLSLNTTPLSECTLPPISLYVTPYHYNDPDRKWLREELDAFSNNTRAKLVQLIADQPASIENHFKCITVALDLEFNN